MRRSLFNNQKDTVNENIIDDDDNLSEFPRTPVKSHSSRNTRLAKYTDTNNNDSSSLSRVSGFESVIMKKKSYFKRIKKNNKKKHEEILRNQRIEIISKFILYVFSNVINIISIFNYILQTYFDKKKDESSQQMSNFLLILEISSTFYFSLEYVLIFSRVKGSILRFLFSFDSLVDLITIAPSMISYFWLIETKLNLSFIRIFRIFRVFRILRIYKSLRMIQNEVNAEKEFDESEIKETSNPIKLQAFTIIVVLLCNFFICSGLVLGLQDLIDGAFNVNNMTFFDAFYFIIITCSTTGYGDIRPTHPVSRLFVICVMFTLIGIISHQVTKLVNLLNIWGPGLVTFSGSGHVIVICDQTINLTLFIMELKKKSFDLEIVLISKEIKSLPSSEYPFNKVHLMSVSTIDLEVLERANTKEADSIFIFSTKTVQFTNQKEKLIDFLILKINRYYSNVGIYVQTLYSERIFSDVNSSSKHRVGKRIRRMDSLGANHISDASSKNIPSYKKIIPILRLKSLMISKSAFIPGFATFAQNLLFNDSAPPLDLDPYDPLMQSYFLGCENKIHVRPFPAFFLNKEFCEAVLLVYSKSIFEYFSKVATSDNRDQSRPVLLIGVVEKYKFSKFEIKLLPEKLIIKAWSLGIFISYNGNNYLETFLDKFNNRKEYEIESCQNSANASADLHIRDNRRTAFSDYHTKFGRASSDNDLFANENDKNKNFETISPVKSRDEGHHLKEAYNSMKSLSKFLGKENKSPGYLESNKSGSSNSSENSDQQKKDTLNNSNKNKSKNKDKENILSQLNSLISSKKLVYVNSDEDEVKVKKNNKADQCINNMNNINVNHLDDILTINRFNSQETASKSPLNPKKRKTKQNSFTSIKLKRVSTQLSPKSVKKENILNINISPIKNSINSNLNDIPTLANNTPDNINIFPQVKPFLTKCKKANDKHKIPSFKKYHNNANDEDTSPFQTSSQNFLNEKMKMKTNNEETSLLEEKYSKTSMSIENEEDVERREAFMRRKNMLLRVPSVFNNQHTRNNMLLFQSLEDKNAEELQELIEKETSLRYGKLENYDDEVHEYFIENRIYDVEKNNISDLVSDHIIIIGYQDNLSKLVKLIQFHNSEKEICIMTQHDFDEKIMNKLLKQFKSLIHLKGEPQNPFHLLNAGVHKSYFVIFLVENIFLKTNEDMNKILSFKSIDYFFKTNMILELWDNKSTRLIGYQPLDKETNVIHNEFLHPQFLAGRIIYMSHLDRIAAITHMNEYVVETWIDLLGMGFKSASTGNGNKTLFGNTNRQGFPVSVSIDVPEGYVGKEFYTLTSDLLSLEHPVIPLGIYIENPLTYLHEKNQGRINQLSRNSTTNLKIVTSYKKKLVNFASLDKIEQGYMDDLKVLREISYNDKVVLDYVDITKPHLPIFITNPPPGFIIDENCKVMVMFYHSPKNFGLKEFQKNYLNRKNKKFSSTSETMNEYALGMKNQLVNSQDNFYYYVNTLKERIQSEFTLAFKYIEKQKVDN